MEWTSLWPNLLVAASAFLLLSGVAVGVGFMFFWSDHWARGYVFFAKGPAFVARCLSAVIAAWAWLAGAEEKPVLAVAAVGAAVAYLVWEISALIGDYRADRRLEEISQEAEELRSNTDEEVSRLRAIVTATRRQLNLWARLTATLDRSLNRKRERVRQVVRGIRQESPQAPSLPKCRDGFSPATHIPDLLSGLTNLAEELARDAGTHTAGFRCGLFVRVEAVMRPRHCFDARTGSTDQFDPPEVVMECADTETPAGATSDLEERMLSALSIPVSDFTDRDGTMRTAVFLIDGHGIPFWPVDRRQELVQLLDCFAVRIRYEILADSLLSE